METLLITILLGSVTGAILALTAAGATIIAVPLLIFGLHLTVAEAAPIALLAVCLASTSGALFAHAQGNVRYRAAGLIAVAGVITAPLGIWSAQRIPNEPLTIVFALVLFFAAVDMWRQVKKQSMKPASATDCESKASAIPCQLEYSSERLIWTWPCARALAFSGAITGFLSGLLGVGGGFVIVPALKKATNLPMQTILATALAVVAIVSAAGVLSATLISEINWLVALSFSAGALIGMLIGRVFAHRLAGLKLQQGFAIVAMGVSVGMIIRLFLTS